MTTMSESSFEEHHEERINSFSILNQGISESAMKQFYPRSTRHRIFSIVLLCIISVIMFNFMQRTNQLSMISIKTSTQMTTQLPIISIPSSTQMLTQVYSCSGSNNAIKISFLSSRPFCIHLLSNDIVSNSISRSRSWMPHQTRLISLILAESLSKPAVFLDIGANIGWFTLVMSTLGHKVIAIEPLHDNVKRMQASIQASGVSEHVTVYPNGLGIIPSTCILYSDNNNIGDGHTICGISSEKDTSKLIPRGYSIRQTINSTRLDTLVSQNIDVMKIDVEGSELYAVQSGSRLFDQYQIRHIISEFSPRMMREKGSDPYEYLKFFISRGYNIRIVNDELATFYERNAWRTVAVYKSDDDLRRFSNGQDLELWFSKN